MSLGPPLRQPAQIVALLASSSKVGTELSVHKRLGGCKGFTYRKPATARANHAFCRENGPWLDNGRGCVAAAWLGHSTQIANKHYWQVTEVDFEAAVKPSATTGEAIAAQNAAQSVCAGVSLALQRENHHVKKTPELQGFATLCKPLQLQSVGDTGFEPVTSAV